MGDTTIEWVRGANGERGRTWNPIRGCSRISPGCGGGGSFTGTADQRGGCYAEGIAARFSGEGQPFHGFAEMTEHGPRWTGKVALVSSLLDEPLRRRKPTTYFCSMFDLFHEGLSNDDIAAVFGVMVCAYWHTFQILTKRSGRMRAWFDWLAIESNASDNPNNPAGYCGETAGEYDALGERVFLGLNWPAPNVHLGVSVESAKYKPRLDDLRASPAAVRFASLEPLLEDLGMLDLSNIDQVIAGAESGHGARPMREEWVRSIRDQAKAHGTAFFYKQRLNERGRKVSLPMLDGQTWAELPLRPSNAKPTS